MVSLIIYLDMSKPVTVLGFYGPVVDGGNPATRWDHWRPTVDVVSHADLLVERFHLLHDPSFAPGATLVAGDMRQVSPETEVSLHEVPIHDAWDFEEVYGALHDFALAHP